MACTDYKLTILADGVPLPLPRKDSGCVGEVRLFRAESTLPGTVTYRWTMDGLQDIASTEAYYEHTYDDKIRRLYCVASNSECNIQVTVNLVGKKCTDCDIDCYVQTAAIPGDILYQLVDTTGKVYTIDQLKTVCDLNSNTAQAQAIKRAILNGLKCNKGLLSVNLYYNNPGQRSCLTLTISNSPVKFKEIWVGRIRVPFDTTRCDL